MQGEQNMKWYKLVFKQKQPIHIGGITWGVVNETEFFIPGWTMWGALTNAFILQGLDEELNQNKIEISEIFETITNFYPVLVEDREDTTQIIKKDPLFPIYKNGELQFGDYSEDKFRFSFVDTFVSTAVEPVSRKAKDKSLHEVDFVLPQSKSSANIKGRLYWVGLLGVKEQHCESINNKFLNNDSPQPFQIYIGGERRYGYGEIELLKESLNYEISDEELAKWNLDREGKFRIDSSTSDADSSSVILRNFFHCYPEVISKLKFLGEIRVIAEFNFTQYLPYIKEAEYFITPGSRIFLNGEILRDKQFLLKKGKLMIKSEKEKN